MQQIGVQNDIVMVGGNLPTVENRTPIGVFLPISENTAALQ